MSDRRDDEITHYRARVDQIPERPEATPERAAMSDERIAELREDVEDVSRETNSTVHRSLLNRYVGYLNDSLDEIDRQRALIAERDAEIGRLEAESAEQLERFNTGWDHLHNNANETLAEKNREIERLRGWLRVLRDGLSSDYEWYSDDSVDRARRALAGEAVPE